MEALAARTWDVLLLGGASGSGKTSVSYRLARHFGVALTEVDDLVVALEAFTTPEQQPLLHYWRTHPEAAALSAEQIVQHHIAVSQHLAPALAAVIANHLETRTPLVLEGDFLLPALAAQAHGDFAASTVRAVFIHEPDEAQLRANFAQRERNQGPQHGRARVSWLHGEWLKHEAERYGVPIISARPWESAFERVLEALNTG